MSNCSHYAYSDSAASEGLGIKSPFEQWMHWYRRYRSTNQPTNQLTNSSNAAVRWPIRTYRYRYV